MRIIIFRTIALISFFILLGIIISYARGYRFNTKTKQVVPSGVLAVSSSPKAAKIYVNGELKGVTDLNMTLPAGNYSVVVKKEGYTDWSKDFNLKGEIVLSADATLFPKNPSLSPITSLGVVKAIPLTQSDKVIIFSENDDPEKDGIYTFDTNTQPLSFFPPLKLIVLKKNLPADINFHNVIVHDSPDAQQAIFDFTTETDTTYSYLFSLNDVNTSVYDISASEDNLLQAWKTQKDRETTKIIETFPREMQATILNSFSIIAFSPDETKLLYRAKENVTLPPYLLPRLIGTNQTTEERDLKIDHLYVYDKKEDKNFPINLEKSVKQSPTPTQSLLRRRLPELSPTPSLVQEESWPIFWYVDSKHLAVMQDKQIVMTDYDGTNTRTVYSGPFEKDFFYITNDGKLFILTNLNPQNNKDGDIYEVGIR